MGCGASSSGRTQTLDPESPAVGADEANGAKGAGGRSKKKRLDDGLSFVDETVAEHADTAATVTAVVGGAALVAGAVNSDARWAGASLTPA